MPRRGSKRGSRSPTTYPDADLTPAGQRRAVWEGRAMKTRGGLTRGDLMISRSTGKIVSRRASRASSAKFAKAGLRPDPEIGYKGVRAPRAAENADWEALLSDA